MTRSQQLLVPAPRWGRHWTGPCGLSQHGLPQRLCACRETAMEGYIQDTPPVGDGETGCWEGPALRVGLSSGVCSTLDRRRGRLWSKLRDLRGCGVVAAPRGAGARLRRRGRCCCRDCRYRWLARVGVALGRPTAPLGSLGPAVCTFLAAPRARVPVVSRRLLHARLLRAALLRRPVHPGLRGLGVHAYSVTPDTRFRGVANAPGRVGDLCFPSPPTTSARAVGSPTLVWSPRQPPRTRTRGGRHVGTPGADHATAPPPARARVTWGAARGNCGGGGGDGGVGGDGGGGRAAPAGPAPRLRRLCRYHAPTSPRASPRPARGPGPTCCPSARASRCAPPRPPGPYPSAPSAPRTPFVFPSPRPPPRHPSFQTRPPAPRRPFPAPSRRAPPGTLGSGSAPSPRTRRTRCPTHPSAAPLAADPSPGLPARLRESPLCPGSSLLISEGLGWSGICCRLCSESGVIRNRGVLEGRAPAAPEARGFAGVCRGLPGFAGRCRLPERKAWEMDEAVPRFRGTCSPADPSEPWSPGGDASRIPAPGVSQWGR